MATVPIRATLADTVTLVDVGVRSGQEITVALRPAADQGLWLHRTDVDARWPVSVDTALSLPDCMAIGDTECHVLFMEHLLAVLAAAGITDAMIEVSGPEVPLFDGSAGPLWEAVQKTAVVPLSGEISAIDVEQPLIIDEGNCFIAVLPAQQAEYHYLLEHDHPLIGRQWATYRPDSDDFGTQIAPARTFITYERALEAQQAGQLKGGSERNAVVIYPDRLSADPGLPQAFARHKLLDLLGDLYLLGRPVHAQIIAARTGHQHNLRLTKRLAELL